MGEQLEAPDPPAPVPDEDVTDDQEPEGVTRENISEHLDEVIANQSNMDF